MSTDERQLPDLEREVAMELREASSSQTEPRIDTTPAEWLYDPTEVEREEVGLRNILGAVWTLEER